jgi:hypothetical protein
MRRGRFRLLKRCDVLGLAVAVATTAVCAGRESIRPAGGSEPSVKSFALYILSRGQGVPDEAREAMGKVRAILDEEKSRGVAVTVQSTRIGLEGETKLCAEFEDEAAGGSAFRRASEVVKGVDLVNLVVEPCGGRKEGR